MKNVLLASAAALALLATPLALAQSADPAPTAPPAIEQADPGAAVAAPGVVAPTAPYAAPRTPPSQMEAAPAVTQSYDAQSSVSGPMTTAEQDPAQTDQNMSPAYTQSAEANAPDTMIGAEAAPAAEISLAAMQEHARDAGMTELPMAPAQVCAPRSIEFQQSRLDSAARRQLVAAVDRASACELRTVTINAPQSRAEAVRRELIASGVDEAKITVEPAAAGELDIDMAFNGVAASTPAFAAMFNSGAQFASAEPAPSAATPSAEQGYAPTGYQADPTGAVEPDSLDAGRTTQSDAPAATPL